MFTLLTKAVQAIAKSVEHAPAIRQLQAMSDRDLRDIGVSRAEIEAIVTGKTARPNVEPALIRPAGSANRRTAPTKRAALNAA